LEADGNPEAIIVGSPLDGSKNRDTYKIGDKFEDVTGIVHYQFGFYYVLPTKNITRISSATPDLPPPTTLVSDRTCSGLTFGDYNIENFQPGNAQHAKDVAAHIVNFMKSPDVLFVQEVQDNSGATDNGVVDSNVTLSVLVDAIKAASPSSNYAFTYVNPVDKADGGQPGGNIRVAYLYKPDVVRLRNANPGGPTDANEVLPGPTLKYNPGRIDPANPAFVGSRKPLAAEWETLDGLNNFFTVNVHWESKGGSSSLEGDARPPVNLPVEKRTQQANVTAVCFFPVILLTMHVRVSGTKHTADFHRVNPGQGSEGRSHHGGRLQRVLASVAHHHIPGRVQDGRPRRGSRHRGERAVYVHLWARHGGAGPYVHQLVHRLEAGPRGAYTRQYLGQFRRPGVGS
jgi:hypothetical protein